MASIATSTHLPVLGEPHEHTEVGHVLEATLHELVDLSLSGKQRHWNVVGPLFRPLHLHLDELVESWRELADTVAERAVAVGFSSDGQARTVAAALGFSLDGHAPTVAAGGLPGLGTGPVPDPRVVR